MFLTEEISHSSLPPPEREVSTAGMANSTGGNHLFVFTSPFSTSYGGRPAGAEVAGKGGKKTGVGFPAPFDVSNVWKSKVR